MLRSAKANRRKSASSSGQFKPFNPPIDPEISRRDAEAAALCAFNRAQERRSGDLTVMHTQLTNHNLRRQDENHRYHVNRSGRPSVSSAASTTDIKRTRSVRFVGSKAAPQRPLGPRRITETDVPQKKLSIGSLRPRALTNDAAVPASYRPPSRCSSLGKVPFEHANTPGSAGYTAALAAYDEYYTREDDVASTPSSYRKIRRSKSLLHNNNTGVVFGNGTPASSRLDSSRPSSRAWGSRAPGLRAPKSMSFLQGTRQRLRTSTNSNPNYDVDVQIARDKFLHQVEQQRLSSQPSFLFKQRKIRSDEREMRRSMRRPSSTNSFGMPIAGPNQLSIVHDGKMGTVKAKARKASNTFKRKIRGLFKRTKSEDGMPPQEVESTRNHIGEYQMQIGAPSSIHDEYLDVPHPDEENVLRVPSRVPSLHAIPSHQQLRSLAGSMQSMRSEASGGSRLTSWTASETGSRYTSTMNDRDRAAERERQRLSIINENGTHKTSSSFTRPTVRNQFSPYPIFHFPGSTMASPAVALSSHVHPLPGGLISPVDSARVYSALMKRLDETSPQAKLKERHSQATLNGIDPPTPVPLRRSSLGETPRASDSTKTIKSVPHGEEAPLPIRESPSHGDLKDFMPPVALATHVNDTGSVTYKSAHKNGRGRTVSNASTVITSRAQPPKVNYRAFPPPVMGDVPSRDGRLSMSGAGGVRTSFAPQEVALQMEPVLPAAKGLRETRSTFFGTSDVLKIGRVASPYRQAIAEAERRETLGMFIDEKAEKKEDGLEVSPFRGARSEWPIVSKSDDSEVSYVSDGAAIVESIGTSVHTTPTKPHVGEITEAGSAGSKRSDVSESVYSRTTSGQSPPFESIDESLEKDWSPGKHGSAILLDRKTYRFSEGQPKHRTSTSVSSQDWKTWMSGQVRGLDSSNAPPAPVPVQHVVPKRSLATIKSKASMQSFATVVPWRRSIEEKIVVSGPSSFDGGRERPGLGLGLVRTRSKHVREEAQIHGDDTNVGPGNGSSKPGSASAAALNRGRWGLHVHAQPVGDVQGLQGQLGRATSGLVNASGLINANGRPMGIMKKSSQASIIGYNGGSGNLNLDAFPQPPPPLPSFPPPPPPPPVPQVLRPGPLRTRSTSRGRREVGRDKEGTSMMSGALPPPMKTQTSKTRLRNAIPLAERTTSASHANIAYRSSSALSSSHVVGNRGGGYTSNNNRALVNKSSIATIRPVTAQSSLLPAPVREEGKVDTPNKLRKPNTGQGRRGSGLGGGGSWMERAYTPSPGLRGLVEKQFGSANKGDENWMPGGGERYGDGSVGAGVEVGYVGGEREVGSESPVDPQVLGSRRMVDMFLSSRRRRANGSEDSGAVGGGAFV